MSFSVVLESHRLLFPFLLFSMLLPFNDPCAVCGPHLKMTLSNNISKFSHVPERTIARNFSRILQMDTLSTCMY